MFKGMFNSHCNSEVLLAQNINPEASPIYCMYFCDQHVKSLHGHPTNNGHIMGKCPSNGLTTIPQGLGVHTWLTFESKKSGKNTTWILRSIKKGSTASFVGIQIFVGCLALRIYDWMGDLSGDEMTRTNWRMPIPRILMDIISRCPLAKLVEFSRTKNCDGPDRWLQVQVDRQKNPLMSRWHHLHCRSV